MRYKGYVMNDNQIIITYGIARNTSSENQRITYFVYTIPEENTENLDWLHTVLYSDPIIPCEIEAKAEQALTRHLRKHKKYQHREIIFKRNNHGEHAISGIENVGFEWRTTRKSSWRDKVLELDTFFLYIQYHFKENPSYRVCKTLEIIPKPLTSETPVLVQFKGIPDLRDLVKRETLKETLHVKDTSLNEWKRKHILVSRAGYRTRVFYYVSHINQAFAKRFSSKKPTDKRWYRKTYKNLRFYYGK